MSGARPAVLLLGTYHMANPGLDLFNIEADDVRGERRQNEIEQAVGEILRFQPTKVAVEVLPARKDELEAEYRAYQAGRFDLPSDEVYQLGFRIAARSGHPHLYPIDVMISRDVDPFQRADEHGQTALVEQMTRGWQTLGSDVQEWLSRESVGEVLRRLNAPERASQEQRLYLQLARMGAGDDYPGVAWLAGWYERNLAILANLMRITKPDDRVCVLYGSGHVPLLRQFMQDSSLYDLGDVGTYLG